MLIATTWGGAFWLVQEKGESLLQDSNQNPYINPRLIEMFGAETEEQFSSVSTEQTFTSEEDYQRYRKFKLTNTQEPALFQRRRLDQSTLWCEMHQFPVNFHDEKFVITWVLDVSRLKVAEQRFQSFTDSAADWFWEMDEELRFSYFSEKFEEITGVPPEALIGQARQETGVPGVTPDALNSHLEYSAVTSDKPDTDISLNILVAEDLLPNQMVASKMLKNFGHQVKIVENGVEAIDEISQDSYDLILMDVRMPIMDGLTATGAIRGRTDALVNIQIIAMTANATNDDVDECMGVGMNGFIVKPITTKGLKDSLQKWFLMKWKLISLHRRPHI
jgi:CheY-like chemotaxis protein